MRVVDVVRTSSGYTGTFPAVTNKGALRAGFVNGDFDVYVRNPSDSSRVDNLGGAPDFTVAESAQVPGTYLFTPPGSFFTTFGAGSYPVTVVITSVVGGAPKVEAVAHGVIKVSDEDVDSLLVFDFVCP